MAFAKLMAGNNAAKKRKLDPVPDNATLPLPRSMVACEEPSPYATFRTFAHKQASTLLRWR